MGLDIRVYTDVVLTEPHERTDACYEDAHHIQAFVYEGFERSLRGLEADRCYESVGTSWHFRAGSYSGYGDWRRTLCLAAASVGADMVWVAPDRYVDAPFHELVHFADNEGTLGPEACADLAKDFANERAKVMADRPEEDAEWFDRLYDTWAKACADAADTGMIVFH